jgi:hypothetical protein
MMSEDDHKKTCIKKIFTYMAVALGTLASIAGIITAAIYVYDRIHSSATLTSTMTKFQRGNKILYLGSIKNNSAAHAEEVDFKGEFENGFVNHFDAVSTVNFIESKIIKHGKPRDYIAFSVKKFSFDSDCKIDIRVEAKSEIKEKIYISWKNNNEGYINVIPSESTCDFIEKNDNSYNARKKWPERNNKGIRK